MGGALQTTHNPWETGDRGLEGDLGTTVGMGLGVENGIDPAGSTTCPGKAGARVRADRSSVVDSYFSGSLLGLFFFLDRTTAMTATRAMTTGITNNSMGGSFSVSLTRG